jgi:hypothetical protein
MIWADIDRKEKSLVVTDTGLVYECYVRQREVLRTSLLT